jgi:hypothetical protein
MIICNTISCSKTIQLLTTIFCYIKSIGKKLIIQIILDLKDIQYLFATITSTGDS